MAQRKKNVAEQARDGAARRPAGTTAATTGLLVLVLSWFDIDLSATDAAIIISGLTSLASMIFTPRSA